MKNAVVGMRWRSGTSWAGRALALAWGGALLCPAVAPTEGRAQEISGLLEAVNYYHEFATSDLGHIHEATRRLEAIAIENPIDRDRPTAWLPSYWTAFAYTQLALFSKDGRAKPFIELAQLYFDEAWKGKPDDALREADFHALQGLILRHRANSHPANAQQHRVAEREAMRRARSIDPNNPMVLSDAGLALLPHEQSRVRAYELLDRAIELYEPRLGTVTPNWGREFIDVWTGGYPRIEGSDGQKELRR